MTSIRLPNEVVANACVMCITQIESTRKETFEEAMTPLTTPSRWRWWRKNKAYSREEAKAILGRRAAYHKPWNFQCGMQYNRVKILLSMAKANKDDTIIVDIKDYDAISSYLLEGQYADQSE